ncbi:RagB/SusD family nutrient uptake outer membrane protein [Parabacteroides provencensis]|uniref:RagB/SusD family nutrient uptake outer membrane protein n=1 Tax=Parabacteroides provencensis TaxID=1944636 RepID=UPI00130405BF|nr:RagB/SusD family nutrient uptake outer membrane protein [Parabacteroides provencensis]
MKTKYLLLSLALPFFFSCSSDVLDQIPSTSVSDDQIYTDVAAAKTALMGAYSHLGEYRYHTLAMMTSDLMGEDLTMTSGAYGFPTYNWLIFSYQYAQTPVDDPWWTGYCAYIWRYAYKSIDQANTIIASKETMLPEGGEKEDMIAQAYGLRGYNFLLLTQLFARAYTDQPDSKGILLRLKPGSSDESENVGRSSVREAYDQIVSDLTYLYEHSTGSDAQFMNKKGAAMLLARTYLNMADYKNAEKYATLATGSYDGSNLMSQADYKAGFKDHNKEWLWFFNFTPNTCNLYASIPSFYWYCSYFEGYEYGAKIAPEDVEKKASADMLKGYSTVRAAASFRNMFDDTDCRKLFPGYVYEDDGYFVSKFGHRTRIGDAEYPFCRIAEGYLIKAEAELQMGNASVAKDVLNTLQVARGAKTTDATVDNIWYERRKELYGEGFALNDMKRLQKPLKRVGLDQWAGVKELPANSSRFMLPIPNTELFYNKQLTDADQNEYWRN